MLSFQSLVPMKVMEMSYIGLARQKIGKLWLCHFQIQFYFDFASKTISKYFTSQIKRWVESSTMPCRGLFLILLRAFCSFSLNKQPESFQSPSMRAFPFPSSFLLIPLHVLPLGPFCWPADIQVQATSRSVNSPACRGASQVSHSFHELCPSLPPRVIYRICHCVPHPLSKCLARIQVLIQDLLLDTSNIVNAFICIAVTSTL